MVKKLIPAALAALLPLLASCNTDIKQVQVEEQYPAPEKTFDLNTVTLKELETISELRSDVARNIIAFRERFGFRRVEELLNVEGIGETTFLKIRRYFFVSDK